MAKHHPGLENHYDKAPVGQHTWEEDGVTPKDVKLAKKIETANA